MSMFSGERLKIEMWENSKELFDHFIVITEILLFFIYCHKYFY